MVYRNGKEHDEDANSGPHDFEKLDPLPLHLFLSPLHPHVLHPSPGHVSLTHRLLLLHMNLLHTRWRLEHQRLILVLLELLALCPWVHLGIRLRLVGIAIHIVLDHNVLF